MTTQSAVLHFADLMGSEALALGFTDVSQLVDWCIVLSYCTLDSLALYSGHCTLALYSRTVLWPLHARTVLWPLHSRTVLSSICILLLLQSSILSTCALSYFTMPPQLHAINHDQDCDVPCVTFVCVQVKETASVNQDLLSLSRVIESLGPAGGVPSYRSRCGLPAHSQLLTGACQHTLVGAPRCIRGECEDCCYVHLLTQCSSILSVTQHTAVWGEMYWCYQAHPW